MERTLPSGVLFANPDSFILPGPYHRKRAPVSGFSRKGILYEFFIANIPAIAADEYTPFLSILL